MNNYIILLRGINVGGHKRVPMADLRDLLCNSGFKNVKTYIQSGNIVFESFENNTNLIEKTISEAIQSHFGFEVSVLVKTRQDLLRIFNNSPFIEEKKKSSYFTLLHTIPREALIKEASRKVYEGEEYYIINDCIYFYCEAGYGKAKFNMNYFERQLETSATSRNYNTIVKLLAMSQENKTDR